MDTNTVVNSELDAFFDRMSLEYLALTFDDVRLEPRRSGVRPSEVDLSSYFSRHVQVKIPLISAAMDTITEAALAIELARHGGLGIIHRNLSLEEQARQVDKVKRHLHGKINTPVTFFADDTIQYILRACTERNFSFRTFPLLDRASRKLVGIVTRSDFELARDTSLPVSSIMSEELVVADPACTIEDAYHKMLREKKKMLPLVTPERLLTGLYVYRDVNTIMSDERSLYNVDENGQLRVGAAIGVGENELERAVALVRSNVDVLVVDTAHGHSNDVFWTLAELKSRCSVDVVAGNVCAADAVRDLIDAGADGIKVGVGPGSICTTRIVAGVGIPQVTAIYDCARAARGTDVPVCADGGIRYSGDMVLALAVGAHTVMLGSLFAGTEEAPGELVIRDGQRFKTFRGMGSLGAMKDSRGSRERYRQGDELDRISPEGVEGELPCKGPLLRILPQYVGGIRAGMGYVGATTIHDLHQRARLRRITNAGLHESHPHDVVISKEAPNYRRSSSA